ncbi:MAG: MFS transporter [Limnobacter sp.]|nr:MFS transporter [Limnobacter sp.]
MQQVWIGFFYAAYFAFVGLYSPFLGPYLKSIGHGLDVIALALGLMQIMRVFGPLAWGWVADVSGRRVLLMRVAVGFGLLMSVITFLNDRSTSHLIVCLVLLNLSISGLIPMSDVQAMDVCKGDAGAYGRVRLFGSLGFILAVLGFGFWADHLGFTAFPVWVFVCLGLAWGSTWCLREAVHQQDSSPGKPSQKQGSVKDTLRLLLPSDLRLFWLASFFMVLAHGVFYSFFSLYLIEFEYSESAIGGLWALGVMLEVAFFALQTRIFAYFDKRVWLLISYAACAVRFAVVAMFPETFWIIALSQCAHALTFAAHHTATITWLRERVPIHLQGRAQAMYATIAYGVGGTSGTFLGRWAWDYVSPSFAFWVAALAGLFASMLGYRLIQQGEPELSTALACKR